MRGGVHPVHVAERAHGAGLRGDRGHVGPGAEDVAGRGHRHQPGPLAQQRVVLPGGQFPRGQVHLGPADHRAGPPGRLHPRPDVRVMVQPGHDHLVTRAPVLGERSGEPVGQRGHVRPENDARRVTADQVGDCLAALGHDRVGPRAGRERAVGVAQPGPVRVADRVDHRRGKLGARRTVEVGVTVGQCRVGGPYRADIQAHRLVLPRLSALRVCHGWRNHYKDCDGWRNHHKRRPGWSARKAAGAEAVWVAVGAGPA